MGKENQRIKTEGSESSKGNQLRRNKEASLMDVTAICDTAVSPVGCSFICIPKNKLKHAADGLKTITA